MSKITNDGLTRSGTGCCFYSCTDIATVGVIGLTHRCTVNVTKTTTVFQDGVRPPSWLWSNRK